METPYLTEKTCRKRVFAWSLPLLVMGLILGIALSIQSTVSYGLLSGLLIGSGYLVGEATFWYRLLGALRRGARLPDPLREAVPTELGVLQRRHLFLASLVSWLCGSLVMLVSQISRAPEELKLFAGFLTGFFMLFTGFHAIIRLWELRRYTKFAQESHYIAEPIIESTFTPFKNWWMTEETKQEIKRR
jgi:hypothetical protein